MIEMVIEDFKQKVLHNDLSKKYQLPPPLSILETQDFYTSYKTKVGILQHPLPITKK